MDDPKIEETELGLEVASGLERRRFLRNAGLAGMAAAWSAPMIQTVAYATGTHPPPGSPFTPGECPRDDGKTTTGDTHDHDTGSHDTGGHDTGGHGDADGCSHGYWKTHTSKWSGYSTGADWDATFGVNLLNPNKTLLQALDLGGGGVNSLAREAVAALLNAAHSGVDYSLSTAQVISTVKWAAQFNKIEEAKDFLEKLNGKGCPL